MDKNIVIKEADKEGAVVIMDKEHYLSMLLDILNNQNYYELLESNPKKTNKLTYTRLLNKLKGHFTKKDDYLRDFEEEKK